MIGINYRVIGINDVTYHMVVGVEEVGMVGKPAKPKHNQYHDEHLGQLQMEMIRIMID